MNNHGVILNHRGTPMVAKSSAYIGGTPSRKRTSQAFRRSLPYDEDHALKSHGRTQLRLECQDMRRNNPIVAGVCERFSDNIIGPSGLMPQAKTADQAWNAEAESFWAEWTKVCDFRHRVNMRDMQRLAVQSRLVQGDMGFVLLANGQFQPIEAERIDTPNKLRSDSSVIDGIQIDKAGRARRYHVISRNERGGLDREKFKAFQSKNFVHLTRSWRVDQLRAIPELAAVLPFLVDFGRLQEETLNKAQLDAMHSWAIYSQEGPAKAANMGPRNATPDNSLQNIEHFGGGQTYYMRPGESVESLASSTPNPQYVEYSQMLLKIIASALSIPYEFLLLDFSEGSFSSSRAALQQTYNTFSMWQSWLIDGLLQRLWNWRIAKAIKSGEISPAPQNERGVSEWHKCVWSRPGYDWIDPGKEAKANLDNYNLGICSLDDITRKTHGREADDVLKSKMANIQFAHDIAQNSGIPGLTFEHLINSTSAGMATPGSTTGAPTAPNGENK